MANNHFLEAILIFSTFLTFLPFIVIAADDVPVPSDKSQVNKWFSENVQPLSARTATLDPPLVAAEKTPKIINLKADGSGDFKTLTDAVKSIPDRNTQRVVIKVGPGNYTEKVKIEYLKTFITLYGDPNNMPVFVYDGTAAKYGTDDSATVAIEADYFVAANIKFVNSAPRAAPGQKGGQATALRIQGDKSAFFNVKTYGFQDTFCDDKGLHFFKDCYFEGTVDFIFGNGKSIYLNSDIAVIPGGPVAFITAHARSTPSQDTGFSFIHSKITGSGGVGYLGRAWFTHSTTVFAYTDMTDAINPEGWSNNLHPEYEPTLTFGEYSSTGAGATPDKRAKFVKKLTEAEVKPYLTLGYIQAAKWLLPPPQY